MSEADINQTFEVENTMREAEPRDWYPKSAAQELVRKFHVAFGAPVGNSPRSIGRVRGELRKEMLQEELNEFKDAVEADDIVEQFDALIDILVLAYGGLVEMGIDAGPGKREVMRANMSKLDEHGQPIISRGMVLDGFPEGKILKGPNYVAPDLFNVLVKQGWIPTYQEYLNYYKLKDPTKVLEALAGRPSGYQKIMKLVPPTEYPSADTKVITKQGVRFAGTDFFADEPHEYTERLGQNNCVCGKVEVDIVHRVKPMDEPTELGIDWDIDLNAPRRKDNFQDAVMNGWKPDTTSQLRYERHRRELEDRYPTGAYDVTGDYTLNVYRNGEKDVDWDFDAKEPRIKKEEDLNE